MKTIPAGTACLPAALALILALALWACSGCQADSGQGAADVMAQGEAKDAAQGKTQGEAHADEHADARGDACGDAHGHEHGGADASLGNLPLDAIAAARCEHDTRTYLCDVCRYEIGVVKVGPDLIRTAGADPGGGLLVIDTIAPGETASSLEVTGEIQLNENAAVHISPRFAGIIQSVHVDFGARVEPGDVLFEIDSVELGRTRADYERSRMLTELSRTNYDREKSLFEQRIGSEQDMIAAQMTYEQHRNDLKAAEQTLRVFGLSQADLNGLRREGAVFSAGTLPVRAPQAGVVIQKHAVAGELVEPGRDVMLLADLQDVWVWADIYEQDLPQLLAAEKKGPIPVRVRVQAYGDQTFTGTIDYIGATMEERTRTIKVRATVANSEGLLRPGMFCEIGIALKGSEAVLAVPKSALMSDEGQDFVFKHWQEDYYIRRAVSTGRTFFDRVEILSGVAPGDRIVTAGAFLLKSDVLREKMGAGCAD